MWKSIVNHFTYPGLLTILSFMNTRETILSILEEHSPEYVSGETISNSLGITRMAVSKAVARMQEDGIGIESRKHYGYRLTGRADILNRETLISAFGRSGIGVYYLDTTQSTNRDAKIIASEGASLPYVVTCTSQTGGRGRLGRSFESPSGGVYFSLVLSGSDIASPDLVTIASAAAVSEVMERLTGTETSIKWVNDIYIRGKKAVGILTEGIINMEEGKLDKVVIGVGINLRTKESELSSSVRGIATSFYPDGKSSVTRAEVIAECSKRIISIQKEDFLPFYREKCFVLGKDVFAVKGDVRTPCHAYGIDECGHLLVRYEDGREDALSSGEISIRI